MGLGRIDNGVIGVTHIGEAGFHCGDQFVVGVIELRGTATHRLLDNLGLASRARWSRMTVRNLDGVQRCKPLDDAAVRRLSQMQ